MIKKLALLGTVIALAGCAASPIEKARGIREGMAEAEVIAVMGQPQSRIANPYGYALGWSQFGGGTVAVVLRDGKVLKAPQLPAAPAK